MDKIEAMLVVLADGRPTRWDAEAGEFHIYHEYCDKGVTVLLTPYDLSLRLDDLRERIFAPVMRKFEMLVYPDRVPRKMDAMKALAA